MDLHATTIQPLKTVWSTVEDRQNAKITILKAIAYATDLTAKDADNIFAELDRILLDEEKPQGKRLDPAL